MAISAASPWLMNRALASATPEPAKPTSRPPNFVFILADDLGFGDLGCYGATGYATPNCDRMARQGMRFTSFYSASPVCTPSRAALLTGRYPIRTGLTKVLWPYSRAGITPSEHTLASVLRPFGYASACVGKWHLGHLPPHLPTNNGFDTFFGIPYSNDMSRRWLLQPALPLMRGDETIEQPANLATLTQRITQESVHFIRENRSHPFFLYLAHAMPHVPLAVSDMFKGKSTRGLYGDVVEEIDWSVGQVLDTLKELRLDEHTIVVFASDNGPWFWMGADAGSTGGLRGGKRSTFEGGIRVPCIARWPGHIVGGRVDDHPAIMMDWFTTFLSAAGVRLPEDRIIDGRDLRGVLFGTGVRNGDRFFFYEGNTLQACRIGSWKLVRPFNGIVYNEYIRHPRLLFNLDEDPFELHNSAHERPDLVAQFTNAMREFERSV